MRIAKLKVVTSAQGLGMSLRGPKGRGHDDYAQKHVTEAGFRDGEDVVLITEADFQALLTRRSS